METIKEEKKADLEQLLNSLIERGWTPFGRIYQGVEDNKLRYFSLFDMKDEYVNINLRNLTSKESGLWQFVCKNGMVDKQYGYIEELKWWKADDDEEGHDNGEERYSTEYQFWLIESSLKDESELEDFLLNSINLD